MRSWLAAIASLVVGCAGRPDAHEPKPSSHVGRTPPHSVLVVSIDGLRHDYLADTAHALPNLRKLRAEGARARSLRSVWPSVTYPAHATLVTGVSPARHGIVNNLPFDPFEKNDGGWYWYVADLKVPTLWDAARDAGIDVGNATWPVTVGAPIRWNVPQFWRAKNVEDEKLLRLLSTPEIFDGLAHPPGEHRDDRARADAAIAILRAKRPPLMLAYLTDLDSAQHDNGPMSPEAWSTLERIDGLVGEIVAAAAPLPHLTVAIVSDHGFLPVDTDVRPNVALEAEGLLSSTLRDEYGRREQVLSSYDAVTWKAGGSAAIMGRRGRQEPIASRVKALFTKLAADPRNHIGAVLDGAEVEKRGGFPGAIVVLRAANGATFSERYDPPMVAPSKYRGMHGYDPDVPEMGATFVLWGDGIRAGDLGDVDMRDVAPTLARLLGLTLPAAEGHVLERALGQ